MAVTRADVIAEARSWIGTPFKHQGRLKGVGVDCGGLLICVGKALGVSDFDTTGYARVPYGRQLMVHCDEHLTRIGRDEFGPGDVLVMRWRRVPQHVAIVADGGFPCSIIHAFDQVGRVVEHRLDETWAARIMQAYRVPGVE